MDAKNAFAAFLLCLLALTNGLPATSSSLPSQESRQQPLNPRLANAASPRYFTDLYKNFSKSVLHTQANTIRSLQYIATSGADCNTFNFSLSALYENSAEFVLDDTEIRLFYPLAELPKSCGNVLYRVQISARLSDGSRYHSLMGDREMSFSEGYKSFRMGGIIKRLVSLGEPFANITLKVFNISIGQPCDSSFFHFLNRDYDMDTIPMLIVYSYDPVVNTMDGSFTRRPQDAAEQGNSSTAGTTTAQQRRKRMSLPFTCQKNSLVLNTSYIPASLINERPGNFQILQPPTFDLGICGGRCSRAVFPHSSLTHAFCLHGLIETHEEVRRALANPGTRRCCVPAEYQSLAVLVLRAGDVITKLIHNLVVSECSCIDVLDL